MEPAFVIEGSEEGNIQENKASKPTSDFASPKQAADPVVYKLVRVDFDGRLVPATDNELMEVDDYFDYENGEMFSVADVIQTAGFGFSEDELPDKHLPGGDEVFSQFGYSNGGEEQLNAGVECDGMLQRVAEEERHQSASGSPVHPSSSVNIGKSGFGQQHIMDNKDSTEISAERILSISGSTLHDIGTNQSGNPGDCSNMEDELVENETTASTTSSSLKPDFSLLRGEINLDKLTIRELQETFRATFGRGTSVKDKQWLKRRISMGLINSCDIPLTSFIIKDNKLVEKVEDANCEKVEDVLVGESGSVKGVQVDSDNNTEDANSVRSRNLLAENVSSDNSPIDQRAAKRVRSFDLHKLCFFIIFFCLILWESAVAESQSLKLWPKPRFFQWLNPNPSAALLSPSFTISAPPHRHLSAAVLRHRRLILTVPHQPLTPSPLSIPPSSPPFLSLKISISDLSAPLQHGADESYTLTVLNSSASMEAPTVWGAMRGLETFSQLVWCSDSSALAVAVGLRIRDSPIFPHRGVLLDTSRNFYPVKDVLRTIGAMSANKLNVFHWHITDSQSFPIVLPSEPRLAGKGSYGRRMQYSPKDVERIVQFGFDHGVRVMPEIDSPGHTGSWAAAYPEIVSCAGMFWWPTGTDWADRLASEPGSGQLNPLNPQTYKVMSNIIKDMTSLFPESFFHGGADEVVSGCWKTDQSIQSHLSNGGTLAQLLEKFINSTLPLITKRNRTAVYWEDVLLDRNISVNASFLPKEHVILQTWNGGPANTKRLVSSGYRTIVSSSEYYYLDCGHGGFVGNDSRYDRDGGSQGDGGSWCAPFKTWQRVYDYDITEGLSGEERDLVVGGEVTVWSEQADPSVLDGRLWPRAAAMAEALWSGNRDESGRKRYAEATDRLNEWRYRMVERGVAAEPIQPLWCARNPGMCNTLNSS